MQPCIEEIEYWLAKEFNYRQNIVVPNVSWGMGLHECDLLVLRPSGYAAEIEIKRSLSDLKAEAKKRHIHASNKIREFWFAIPSEIISDAIIHIPDRCGVITYERYSAPFDDWDKNGNRIKVVKTWIKRSRIRAPKINAFAEKFTGEERAKLLQLAHMRIWTMKRQQVKMKSFGSKDDHFADAGKKVALESGCDKEG